ncbi:hypothetical protein SASPL_133258 [Salvia splendens]|uniref:F-box domain-containing protein n=1 Tax=Salvia splendens TaxID=180675 RepID=A0A8X8X2D2_SALSN|nr:hypothetical protein SASPL_133258 [Salvia splendens]
MLKRKSEFGMSKAPDLPEELTANILQRLHAEQRLGSAQLVCSTWRRVCKNPAMWRVIDLDYRRCEFDIICRCAVDRSQGQLIELKVINMEEYFGFLNYAADRLEHDDDQVSFDALHSHEDEDFHGEDFCTKHATAIGKSMPNLRHLRLWELYTKNKGVEAILDGCPHLESLDLRTCSGVDLDEALFNRCIKQLKDLILPTDGNTSDPDLLEDPGYESWDVIRSSNLADFCRPDSSDDGFADDDGCGGFADSYDFKPF